MRKRKVKGPRLLASIKKDKGGRPPFKITPEHQKTVKAMVAAGIPQASIADVLGCSEPTLRKHFSAEIAKAQAEANAKVADTLYAQAIGGNTTAMIFWLKCRAGWKEKQEITHLGPDGGPVKFDRIELVLLNG